MGKMAIHMRHKVWVILAVLVLALALIPSLSPAWADTEASLEEVRGWLKYYYVNPIDWNGVDQSSLESMLNSLGDPYTNYLSPKEFDSFLMGLGGSFGGIGIYIEEVSGFVTVVSPMKGTPAYMAGLKSQDRIIKVNGLNVVGAPVSQVVDLIRGEPGTIVVLTVLRGDQELTFKIVRDFIKIATISAEMMEDGIGYIKITSFGETTSTEMKKLMAELDKAGALGYIVDLRYNGGGYLDSALEIADLLVPKGHITHTVDRSKRTQTYSVTGKGSTKPLVLLVNEGSASGSEILAAAVLENGAGVLVGTTTFGKASVQAMVPLDNGSYLKLTTAYYLTPKGNNINGVGLKPTVVVEEYNEQLPRAKEILANLIANKYQLTSTALISLFINNDKGLVNGEEVALSEKPFIENGRTYVPLRFVGESLGLKVEWQQETGKILLHQAGEAIVFTPGSTTAQRGGQEYSFDAPVVLRNNRSYLPVRFLIEMIGGNVNWQQDAGRVDIILAK
ncbi:MAG: PDZ domain-containing protein [Clostridia bacterium]|jgi:carboxyl-terminal processing protease|nr:PDZ domain-containing protein [Clostridia bacterium]